MSQRLSKLQQYLDDGNYEMAISCFDKTPEALRDHHSLELSRAYFSNEKYKQCAQISSKLLKQSDPSIFFQANLLFIKAKFLLGEHVEEPFKQFKQRVNLDRYFTNIHKEIINEVEYIITKDTAFQKSMLQRRQEIRIEGKKFLDLYKREERAGPLEEGMPMFLVSARWFQKWETFVQIKQGGHPEHPGPISHFEIIDHRYNAFFDRRSQKKYTNFMVFPSSRYKMLTKSCWEMLKGNYGGIDLKRFNISVMDKPTEIITEIYLKKVSVRNYHDKTVYVLQITKKQTMKGLLKKLEENWATHGYLYEENENGNVPVNQQLVLEEVDTNGKVYLFSPEKPTKNDEKKKILDVCGKCGKTTNLKFCQCKSMKYCGMNCLKEDRDRHRKKCDLQLNHLKQKSAVMENFKLAEKQYGGKKGLVGLRNLGNTCYMNSGLQCLSNTRQLSEYFMSNKFLQDINYTNPLGLKGNLACAYAELIREMWCGNDSSVSPYNLKKMIGKFSGQFAGYGQQDSQQLISQLIDGLQEDLNLVKTKQTFETNDKIIPDEEASLECQLNYAKRYKSFIRDLMVGQFKSTVICGVCDRKSICFDPYMLISLPVPSKKQQQFFYIPNDFEEGAKRLRFQFDNYSLCGQLKQQTRKYYKRQIGQNSSLLLALVDLQTMEVIEELKDDQEIAKKISQKRNAPDFLCYEIPQQLPNHKIYRVEFVVYSERKKIFEKISYPKFISLPNGITQRQMNKRLAETFFKYTNSKKKDEAQTYLDGNPSIQGNTITVKLNQKLKMLICSGERYTLKLAKQASVNLEKCFKSFASPEILQDKNEWYCNKCKKFVTASKQMEIYKSNKILVLAFKRFNRIWKVRDYIDFPKQFNIGPFIKSNKEKKPIIYELYGVVNHYGSMGGGHYTAYCKNFLNKRWFEFDDSRVSEVDPKSVVTENAYVLFYHLI